ncbi:MAG: hypothetical protein MUC76_07680 [Spirochaetes bacterium]|nr:hypothetical protein [Spirochaetota bacterium]
MTLGKKTCWYILALACILTLAFPERGAARDWSDLDEGEQTVFGSEKEEKYSINAFLLEKEKWEGHYSLMALWLFKYTDYPRYRSLRVLPFWYRLDSKIDDRSRYFIPLLLHYGARDADSSMIANPLYYSDLRGDDADRAVLYLFWWGRDKGAYADHSYFYSPLLGTHHTVHRGTHRPGARERWNISPLHAYWSSHNADGSLIKRTWWAPIIPLTYHHTTPFHGHRNILWLIDYSWRTERGSDRLTRLWLAPLLFHRPGAGGYTHVLPPLFLNNRYSDGAHYTHLLPLFSRWRGTDYGYIPGEKKHDTLYTGGLLTPLFGRTTTRYGEERWSGALAGSSFWFPIIPLYYQSRDAREGTHRNLLWIIDWRTAPEGGLRRFWLIPFVFHEAGDSGYRYYFPFYMRPAGSKKDEGTSYGLFHYKKQTADESVRWFLLYYGRSAPGKGEEATFWAPLYFHDRTPGREITLFLPFYFDYESANRSMHVNILGLSRSVASGPGPGVSLGLGRGERGWHVDTDLSWLYDVVSVSTRLTLKRPPRVDETADPAVEAPIESAAAEKPAGGVSLQAKKTVSREDSEYFWGFRLLFGLTAFEMADSKRHFRLLPLSWLTWDRDSDDRMRWVLNYLSYRSGEVEYLVFFPLYGMQREGRSFKRGYVLNLYWDEYDAPTGLRERTVLWPIVNWYSSPQRSGWRILPFIWHRELRGEGIVSKSTISPLYYGTSAEAGDSAKFESSFSISPLHCAKSGTAEGHSKGFYFFPIIPLFYRSNDNGDTHTNVLWFIDHASSADGADSRIWLLPFYLSRTSPRRSYRYIFPLFYSSSTPRTERSLTLLLWQSSEAATGERSRHLLPLYYSWRSETTSTRFILPVYFSSHSATASSRFIAGLYLHSSPSYGRQNFLGIFDHRTWADTEKERYGLAFNLISCEVSPEIRAYRLAYGLLLNHEWSRTGGGYDFSLLWFIYNLKREGDYFRHSFIPFWYYGSDPDEWVLCIPPLLTYVSAESNGDKFQLWGLGALWYRNLKPAESYERQMLLLGIPYYHLEKPERGYRSTGSLWGLLWESESESETGFRKFSVLKFLYKRVEMNGEAYHQVLGIRF